MCRQETSKQNRSIHYRNGEVVGDFYMFVAFKCLQRIQTLKNSQ